MSKAVKATIGVVVALLILGVGGSWLYINVIKEDAPDELSFADVTTTTDGSAAADDTTTTTESDATPASTGVDGTWTIGPGSTVGYRVKEILFGQDTEGVGRTGAVTGEMTISGTTVTTTEFSADMATVESDESRRDNAFRGDIMNVAEFPTASFTSTGPIDLETIPEDGVEISVSAPGELTLRGTTKPVELALTAKRAGDTIQVVGNLEIVFEEWGIPNPSRGPITTEDRGLLELLLVFARA